MTTLIEEPSYIQCQDPFFKRFGNVTYRFPVSGDLSEVVLRLDNEMRRQERERFEKGDHSLGYKWTLSGLAETERYMGIIGRNANEIVSSIKSGLADYIKGLELKRTFEYDPDLIFVGENKVVRYTLNFWLLGGNLYANSRIAAPFDISQHYERDSRAKSVYAEVISTILGRDITQRDLAFGLSVDYKKCTLGLRLVPVTDIKALSEGFSSALRQIENHEVEVHKAAFLLRLKYEGQAALNELQSSLVIDEKPDHLDTVRAYSRPEFIRLDERVKKITEGIRIEVAPTLKKYLQK